MQFGPSSRRPCTTRNFSRTRPYRSEVLDENEWRFDTIGGGRSRPGHLVRGGRDPAAATPCAASTRTQKGLDRSPPRHSDPSPRTRREIHRDRGRGENELGIWERSIDEIHEHIPDRKRIGATTGGRSIDRSERFEPGRVRAHPRRGPGVRRPTRTTAMIRRERKLTTEGILPTEESGTRPVRRCVSRRVGRERRDGGHGGRYDAGAEH